MIYSLYYCNIKYYFFGKIWNCNLSTRRIWSSREKGPTSNWEIKRWGSISEYEFVTLTTMLCPDPLFDIFGISSQIWWSSIFRISWVQINLYFFFQSFQNKCIIYIYLDFNRLMFTQVKCISNLSIVKFILGNWDVSSLKLILPFSIFEKGKKKFKIIKCQNYYINVCAIQNINVELSVMTTL